MTDILLIIGASSEIGINLINNTSRDTQIIAHYNSSKEELEKLKETNENLFLIKADLSSSSEVNSLINEVETKFGTPNKIVHLASSKFNNIRFKDLDLDSFDEELTIGIKSLIVILKAFLPKLAKEKRGKVVCMLSSVTLNVPPKNLVQYTAIKYMLLGIVKSLASEYADKRININGISPSMIETKFLSNVNEKIVELSAYNNPLKRNAQVTDVVPSINFLLSKDSDYMTGINLPITGGLIF